MRASAASVVRPREIDDIRGAAARAEYTALKDKAHSVEDFKELADSYAVDNDTLRRDLAARDSELEQLRGEALRLEAEKRRLLFRLGRAKATSDEDAEIESDPPEDDEAEQPPGPGDVRYYKKKYAGRNYDVLVGVDDCGHNAWQSGNAPKAKKGLDRLLGENAGWKVMQHCGTCTGGGLWRVRW